MLFKTWQLVRSPHSKWFAADFHAWWFSNFAKWFFYLFLFFFCSQFTKVINVRSGGPSVSLQRVCNSGAFDIYGAPTFRRKSCGLLVKLLPFESRNSPRLRRVDWKIEVTERRVGRDEDKCVGACVCLSAAVKPSVGGIPFCLLRNLT